ncbi:putative short-chain dehydrogenase [Annulohypoxylon stygium]|nr:putative short-chain dehydrogenase [Annulohypoxylon stygium]
MAASNAKGSILVTGANGGLGSAIVEQTASKPEFSAYHGLYFVRDTTRAPALNSALANGVTHLHDVVSLDLTKLDDVRQVAGRIDGRVSAGEIPPIRTLVLNAGFQDFGNQRWTDDGFDTTFAANYLGHWLLTILLLGSIDKEAGRIVVVGSQSHDPNDPRNDRSKAYDNPKYKSFISDAASFTAIAKGEWSPATEDSSFRGGFRRYGASKMFLIMMQHELQARLNTDPSLNKICVLGVDPGTMLSGLQRYASWPIRVLLFQVIYPIVLYLWPETGPVRPMSRSAGDVLEAAFMAGDGGEGMKDKYFNGREPFETSEESRDEEKRKLVWSETVKIAGLTEGETVLENWQ